MTLLAKVHLLYGPAYVMLCAGNLTERNIPAYA
jgi:hypothetical protein